MAIGSRSYGTDRRSIDFDDLATPWSDRTTIVET